MTNPFGLLNFRAPLAAANRVAIIAPDVMPGNTITGWPREALAITGSWPVGMAAPPTIRPIFPGALRFNAANPAEIPTAEQIEVQSGKVTDACLERLALTGNLLVRVQDKELLTQMKRLGTLPPLGTAPAFAFYGPVRLTPAFLRSALLDFRDGLLAASFKIDMRRVDPGDVAWEALALQSFLAGSYEPVLRARDALNADDSDRVPMPEVILGGDSSFAVGISLGWSIAPKLIPSGPSDPNVEVVPALAFLRHVGKLIREPVHRGDGVDTLMVKLFDDEDTSDPWSQRLAAKLNSMGFGDIDGLMPVEQVIREFQISAAGLVAAVARDPMIPPARLALRDFRDLTAQTNLFPRYAGQFSGRANQHTRALIDQWAGNSQRSPLIIVAYDHAQLDADERPQAGVVSEKADLWRRAETDDNRLRMFAADFTRLPPGVEMTETNLELIGYCAPWQKDKDTIIRGPGSLKPSLSRRVPYAEVMPMRMLGVDEKELLDALPPAVADPNLAKASTFKVVRAVSEQECKGYLDQINAYDDAGISYGPCHWSMAFAIDKPKGATELGGLAAYLHYLDVEKHIADIDVFAAQGLKVPIKPGASVSTTARLSSNARFINQLCFVDDVGVVRDMTEEGPRDMIPSWRSFYRWVKIGRSHRTIGLATWDMTLRRLHALLAVPIVLESPLPDRRQSKGSTPTIGSVFTSELAVAQILRWHVKIPERVVYEKDKKVRASDYIADAYAAAVPNDPDDNDAWEAGLITQLRVQLEKFVKKTGTAHDELPQQFDDIATPSWVKSERQNIYAFRLNPRLRALSQQANSFYLAKPSYVP
ncbi:hypothetical protein [Pseudomonas frederiksbergensis]|uniref:hypothetical protein n=1 Tax=Pseudomonas frederiksbergensis TaxID=104087 RepID=UPI003D1BAD82